RSSRRRVARELRLDVTHRVVAERTGEPAAKARQSRSRRRAIPAQELADEGKRIALVPLDDRAAVVDFDRRAARANLDLRGKPDERIAAEPLAADDGLQ